MNQIFSDLKEGDTSEAELYREALVTLKAWNLAPVHITPLSSDYSPKDITFDNVKLTSSVSFRELFPGRPLLSVDNAGRGYVFMVMLQTPRVRVTHL